VGDTSEWLGEDVGEVVGGWDVSDSDLPVFDAFTYEVVADVGVLNAGVVFHVLGEGDGAAVVVV